MPGALPLLALSLLQNPGAEACASLIPPTLARTLAAELPGYAVPLSTDAGELRAAEIDTSGDWPCPFVVLGDFDGNEDLDRAILLKSRQISNARLIGVQNNRGQWQITLNEDWPLTLAESELRLTEAGLYQREDAIKQTAEQFDQLTGLQAENTAFTAGKVNGRYAVYALVDGKWQKLTLRD
jgi:hypothetical protein